MNTQKKRIAIPVEYEEVFPGASYSIDDSLRSLNRSEAIKIVLHMLREHKRFQTFVQLNQSFFCAENLGFCNSIFSTINLLEKTASELGSERIIFTIHCGLELLKILFSLPNNKDVQNEDFEYYEQIFQAILYVNEYSRVKPEDPEDFDIDLAYTLAISSFPYSDFIYDKDSICKLAVHNYKAEELERFCNKQDNKDTYGKYLELFIAKYNCDSLKQYLDVIANVYNTLYKNKTFRLNPEDENYDQVKGILDSISLHISDTVDKEKNHDYCVFRGNPLVCFDGHYMCFSINFLVEKLYKSFIFDFITFNKRKTPDVHIKDIIANFTSLFSEEHLFTNLMTHIYQNRSCKKLSAQESRAIDPKNEPDYYVRNGKYIFLYEYKDVMIKGDFKQKISNKEELDKWINEKFVEKPSGKKSAIKQLAHRIEAIIKGEFPWDNAIPANKKIYPILVVSHSIFCTKGMPYILRCKFREELHNREIDITQINDILLVDQDTLILYMDDLNSKKLSLKTLADEYYKEVETHENIKDKKPDLISYSHFMMSFGDYIINSNNPSQESIVRKLSERLNQG